MDSSECAVTLRSYSGQDALFLMHGVHPSHFPELLLTSCPEDTSFTERLLTPHLEGASSFERFLTRYLRRAAILSAFSSYNGSSCWFFNGFNFS